MKPGLMDSLNVSKMQDRSFMDPKSEMSSRPEDASEEEDLQSNLMSSKIKAENMPPDGNMFAPGTYSVSYCEFYTDNFVALLVRSVSQLLNTFRF